MLGSIKRLESLIYDMKIYFKYKARRGGPFFSRVYFATCLRDDGTVKASGVAYLDYIAPINPELLIDFEINKRYTYTFRDRQRARRAVMAGMDFTLPLILKIEGI